MSDHVYDRAAGLAASSAEDPERRAAYAHAAGCAECAAALAEAEKLLELLDGAAPPPPKPVVMQRTWHAIVSEMGGSHPPAPGHVRLTEGRASAPALTSLALGVSVLLAWFDASGHAFAARIGLECLLIELAAAAAPVVFVARFTARRDAPPAPSTFAPVAAWAALSGQLYLHFRCPASHEAPHLFAFHVGGVVLAALLGPHLGNLVLGRTKPT